MDNPLTRSQIMARIKGRDTGPEVILRRELRARGLQFRINHLTAAGKVDLAFPRNGIAVQVDGCFWHGCPWHSTLPKTNRRFWSTKLHGNKLRDARQRRKLRAHGWMLIRIWEHMLERDPSRAAARIISALRRRPTQP